MASAEVRKLAKAKEAVVVGQAVDPCALDVEALRMLHPVFGCFNPRRVHAPGLHPTPYNAIGHVED